MGSFVWGAEEDVTNSEAKTPQKVRKQGTMGKTCSRERTWKCKPLEEAAWLACVSQGKGTEAGWAISWKETVVRTRGIPRYQRVL